MFVDFNILNQLGSPSINSNTFANRPSAGQVGRLFVSTDTFEIYRDNGTGWDLIGGPGSSTVTGSGAAGQVTYWTGTNSVGGENNLWWDAANNRFGVNTNTPTAAAEIVQTDGVALYSNFTTNAGSGTGTTALWAINNTNSSGYAAVIEEKTPNTTAGQYPLVVKHSLSSGTAGIGMGTGLHFQLPDDAGTYKTTQLTIETIDAAAATYKTRYRFMVQNNGSSTAVAYLNSTGLGLFTATPGAALDVHSTGTIAQFNTTSGTGNTYVAFQRTGTGIWRIGDTYNGGNNFFELHNTVLGVDAMEFQASTNKSTFQAQETYTTGQARGNYFDYNLSVAAGGSFSSPNAITSLGASLDLTLAGNATIPSGARSGLDAYNSIAFTGTGTLTQNQGTQIRAYSNLTTGWAFGGSATGTITHLAGLRVLFPDNTGSAITITNNYGLLINDQTANTGTVTYTNRWGVYQEGASDLNYMAANLLLGTLTNNGAKLQINGAATISSNAGGALSIGGNTINNGVISITKNSSTGSEGSAAIAINATNTGGNTELLIGADETNAIAYFQTAAQGTSYNSKQLSFQPNGGNVLIGTVTNNGPKLTVVKSGGIAYDSAALFLSTGTSATDGLAIGDSGNGAYKSIQSYGGNIVLNSLGNSVLIGTTTAQSGTKLQVAGITDIWSSTNTLLRLSHDGTQGSIQTFTGGGVGVTTLNSSGGNVLIGTTTDAGQKLQVNGNGYFTGASVGIQLNATSAGAGDIVFNNAGNQKWNLTSVVTSYDMRLYNNGGINDFALTIKYATGAAEFYSSIKTGAPTTGTAAAWKLGSRVAATVVVNTTEYIEVDIGGTLYKLATVT